MQRRFAVSWACQCQATHQRTEHHQSNQEEAHTKLILHALDATANGVKYTGNPLARHRYFETIYEKGHILDLDSFSCFRSRDHNFQLKVCVMLE